MSPAAVPDLQTERLTLRGHRAEDLGDCAAMWGDPLVVHHLGGRPLSREEVWTKLLRYVGHWALLDFGYWVVTERISGRFIGEVGFADFKRELHPPLDDSPEMGWVLARWAHGQGFATEAVGAALRWGGSHFGARRTVCLIAPENRRSLRVADKCGYREHARATYKGEPTIVLARELP